MGYLRFVFNKFGLINSFGTHFAFNKWNREYNADIQLLKESVGTDFFILFDRAI